MKIEKFEDIQAWQQARGLVKEIYKVTDQFPKEELYSLTSQMRRAAISIPSNIAEGYKRKNLKEYLQFLSIANASTAELDTQITIAKELYKHMDFLRSESLLEEIQKMLSVLLRKLSARR